MAKIDRFEDIEAWQKAHELTREVYRLTSQGAFAKDFGFRDQIRRAAVSISNPLSIGRLATSNPLKNWPAVSLKRAGTRNSELLVLYKNEVGFPHGEIEDILNLSDPPYYTACPNPFVRDFIAHWSNEQRGLRTESDNSALSPQHWR